MAGVGTGGTLNGVGRKFRDLEFNDIKLIAVDPAGSALMPDTKVLKPFMVEGIG